MSTIDWIVMSSFLAFVVIYGVWKTRGQKNIKEYLLANKSTPWYAVTLSIMATQASAITFLSAPGQAFVDGMRFVQFYFGLPIAMIILSITVVPIFHRLNVYTAYEFLEQRFDLKNRALGSILFLIQRGFAAGFTVFAPALILSMLLGWNTTTTVFAIGGLVIIYTAYGGTEAVNKTHLLQMIIIMTGMLSACYMIFTLMPADISFMDATHIAGKMGKLNAITFDFDPRDKYNFWSGLIGGTFLALSYFGTDQSQVQRYLAGKSIAASRMGLLMNGIIKIPMQFGILFIGAMVFVFFQFVTPPIFFNSVEVDNVKAGQYAQAYEDLEVDYDQTNKIKQTHLRSMLEAMDNSNDAGFEKSLADVRAMQAKTNDIREQALEVITKTNPEADTNDTNYIFLSFVINFLPIGLIGLILAAIISASMSSTSAELNALASTTVIDIYKRMVNPNGSEAHYLWVSKLSTVLWGAFAIFFALFANRMGSLIEAVNILGSLFYGTILGIFLIAFYLKKIGGNATFWAALISEVTVLTLFFTTDIPYLWFNMIGCLLVVIIAMMFEPFVSEKIQKT